MGTVEWYSVHKRVGVYHSRTRHTKQRGHTKSPTNRLGGSAAIRLGRICSVSLDICIQYNSLVQRRWHSQHKVNKPWTVTLMEVDHQNPESTGRSPSEAILVEKELIPFRAAHRAFRQQQIRAKNSSSGVPSKMDDDRLEVWMLMSQFRDHKP